MQQPIGSRDLAKRGAGRLENTGAEIVIVCGLIGGEEHPEDRLHGLRRGEKGLRDAGRVAEAGAIGQHLLRGFFGVAMVVIRAEGISANGGEEEQRQEEGA